MCLFVIKNTNMHSLWLNNMKTRLIQIKKKTYRVQNTQQCLENRKELI